MEITMIEVFRTLPWVMPEEPVSLQNFFYEEGVKRKYEKGQFIPHGPDNPQVSLISKGLVVFCFLDYRYQQQVFSLSMEGRTVGDLEAISEKNCHVIAECLKPTEVYAVSAEKYRTFLRSSVSFMEDYAISANNKHQCVMEGMMANYTLPHRLRLIQLFYSILVSKGPLNKGSWNKMPFSMSITDISKLVSANRSWTSTTVNDWISQGLVKKEGSYFWVREELFRLFSPDN